MRTNHLEAAQLEKDFSCSRRGSGAVSTDGYCFFLADATIYGREESSAEEVVMLLERGAPGTGLRLIVKLGHYRNLF
jgi:hypothetical protein